MPELRSHKRGRSLDQRLFGNSEHRFITASGEAEAEATTSDSEYDSDVIVVGKGRKCPRVSRTPPNHTPSWMRTLPLPSTSPQDVASRSLPDPALLEWHPGTSSQDPPCLHLGEITDLKARVGYLELEAQNNIELRSEMQQNWCQVSAENRQLRQDFSRVSAECRELRQTVSDLIQYRKWEELRRQCEEEDRRGWENVLDTRIAAAEQRAREQVSQLRAGLYDEIESGLAHKVGDADLRNSSSPIPMDVEKPTIEEFLGQLKSNGGLEESRHAPENAPVENGPPTGAPDERQNPVIPGNSQDPPTGPRQWREKMARKQRRSKQSKTAKKNNQTPNTKLQQLEADILELKENIRQKEQARKGSDTHGGSQSNGNEWRVANRKRPANRKTQTLRIQGKYKLVIGSSDDGTRADVTTIQQEIERIAC
jgi:hypothetical protein